MKRESALILAGAVGFLAVGGFLGLRILMQRKAAAYEKSYTDYHRNLNPRSGDDNHGIEYL